MSKSSKLTRAVFFYDENAQEKDWSAKEGREAEVAAKGDSEQGVRASQLSLQCNNGVREVSKVIVLNFKIPKF